MMKMFGLDNPNNNEFRFSICYSIVDKLSKNYIYHNEFGLDFEGNENKNDIGPGFRDISKKIFLEPM